jgi:aspartate/methionine/tyrosine aminotransferase
MLAAVKALSLGDEWYAEVNRVYAERRKVAEEIMEALGCTYDASQQGLFLWGKIPAGAESSEALADRVLAEARVFITPGFIFGSKGERYVRVSLCTPAERMTEALERIKNMNNK